MVAGRTRDSSKLSTKPMQIRRRLRRETEKMGEDLEMLMEADPRYKPLDQWDYQELARGYPRNKRGGFGGHRPKWLTPAIAEEVRRRLKVRAMAELDGEIQAAVEVMKNIMNDTNEDPRLRFDAAKFVIEMVLGKAKQGHEIDVTDKVKTMLAGALVLEGGRPAHPVLDDVEYIVEDDEE